MRNRLLRIVLVCALAIAIGLPAQIGDAQSGCTFELGFGALHELIPSVVGDCTSNMSYDADTGDGLQSTTNGLLLWRKSDNLTAFTDGSQTWLDGPLGLQSRLDSQRFFWEPNPDGLTIVPPPQSGDTCVTAGTSISVIGSDAGAGNVFATFALTNELDVGCTFFGFVGAERRDANDDPLPTRVVRNGGQLSSRPAPTVVSVPPRGSAQFLMHWEQVPHGDETCAESSRLAVTLPDQYLPLEVAIAIRACNAGELDVSAVEAASR